MDRLTVWNIEVAMVWQFWSNGNLSAPVTTYVTTDLWSSVAVYIAMNI
jgi:hypothetical protein